MTGNNNPQVVVIGGGPAGSTVSTLLAQQGVRVELFERETFPRFHIGESLIPETYWVLKRLNMLDKMKASHFIKKHSVQFVNASGKVSTPFYFFDNKPHECSQTWQVRAQRVRSDDARERRASTACSVHEETRVLEVVFEGERAVGVDDRAGAMEPAVACLADVVVDASGQSSMIINKFGLRVADPELNKGAIWTYFEGAYRDSGQGRRRDARPADAGQEGLVLVHPAAQQHRQRRRRRRLRLPVHRPRRSRDRPLTKSSIAA